MKIITAFILLFAIACGSIIDSKGKNETFIQGKWHVAGTVPGDENIAWFLEWEFDDGKFTRNGYPPILQKGEYKVSEDKDNKLKLKLYRQKGTFGEEDSELIIILDKENKTLSIGGKEGFKKVTEENQE